MNTLKVLFIASFLIAAPAKSLDYSDMDVIFRASTFPAQSKLVGTWVGRCIHKTDPYRHWPAFFQFKNIKKSNRTFSQSHTWFNEQTDKYDTYTEQDLNQDNQCKKWLENEQWNPVSYQNGSLSNYYQYPNSKAWRQTRLYQDGIREHIVLAYSLGPESVEGPASYCFFNIRLKEKSQGSENED